MQKIISTRDFADIKRMAQIVNPKVSRKATLIRQKEKIGAELAELDMEIALLEGGIKNKFLGLGTEQLVKKVVSPAMREDGTPYLDSKTGKQLTKTTWEPLPCLTYDEEKNNYILTVSEDVEVPAETPSAGSDFDADAAQVAAQGAEDNDNPFGM